MRQKGQARGQEPRQNDGNWSRLGMIEAGLTEGGWRGGDRPPRYEEAEWTGFGV